MGSFNATCFITHQTIQTDDDVRVIMLRRNASYEPVSLKVDGENVYAYSPNDSMCHSDSFWNPVGSFLKAKYHDYSEVKFTDEQLSETIPLMQEVAKHLYCTNAGKNSSHDLPFDPAKFSKLITTSPADAWEMLWTCAVHEGRVFMKHPYLGRRKDVLDAQPVSFAIVLESTFQEMIARGEDAPEYGTYPTARRDKLQAALDAVRPNAKLLADAESMPPEIRMTALQLARYKLPSIFGLDVGPPYRLLTFDADDELQGLPEKVIKGFLTEEYYFKRGSELLETRTAIQGIELYNLRFSPTSYAPQDYDNQIGQRYAKMVNRVANKSLMEQREDFLKWNGEGFDPVHDQLVSIARWAKENSVAIPTELLKGVTDVKV